MPEKVAFMFHHNSYPKPKIDLKDAEETRQKLQTLQQDYNDIVSKHTSDIGLTPEFAPPIVSKPYPLPLKNHKFVREDTENLLEVGLIERSTSPYVAPIIVVPGKSKLGAP